MHTFNWNSMNHPRFFTFLVKRYQYGSDAMHGCKVSKLIFRRIFKAHFWPFQFFTSNLKNELLRTAFFNPVNGFFSPKPLFWQQNADKESVWTLSSAEFQSRPPQGCVIHRQKSGLPIRKEIHSLHPRDIHFCEIMVRQRITHQSCSDRGWRPSGNPSFPRVAIGTGSCVVDWPNMSGVVNMKSQTINLFKEILPFSLRKQCAHRPQASTLFLSTRSRLYKAQWVGLSDVGEQFQYGSGASHSHSCFSLIQSVIRVRG